MGAAPISLDGFLAEQALAERDAARLRRVWELGARLPSVVVVPAGFRHVVFKVGRRSFAYYMNDHHGDGKIALAVKSSPEHRAELLAGDPERFFVPAYLGVDGWVSMRLDLRSIDWVMVADLVTRAYRLQAPAKLAAALGVASKTATGTRPGARPHRS